MAAVRRDRLGLRIGANRIGSAMRLLASCVQEAQGDERGDHQEVVEVGSGTDRACLRQPSAYGPRRLLVPSRCETHL
jgi:hypothetical protein